MNLELCPWCGEPPKTYVWTELSRCFGINIDTGEYEPDEYQMVEISCCYTKMECQAEDAEITWNWRCKWPTSG